MSDGILLSTPDVDQAEKTLVNIIDLLKIDLDLSDVSAPVQQ